MRVHFFQDFLSGEKRDAAGHDTSPNRAQVCAHRRSRFRRFSNLPAFGFRSNLRQRKTKNLMGLHARRHRLLRLEDALFIDDGDR